MSQNDANAGPSSGAASASPLTSASEGGGSSPVMPDGPGSQLHGGEGAQGVETIPKAEPGAAPSPVAPPSGTPASSGLTTATIVGRLMEPKKLINDAVDWFVVLYDKYPRAFGLTAIGILIAAIGLRAVGLDLMVFVPQVTHIPAAMEQLPLLRDVTWVGDVSESQDCISKGKALGKKYVLMNVTQWVQYEESPQKDKRVTELRIVYTVLPLVDIADTDQVFAEDYQGSGTTERWWGPRRETPMPGTNRYQVSFAGKKGVPLTIVTGARMTFALPFPSYRYAFRQKVGIAANHDYWAYENTEDVICSLTQVIDSKTLVLVPIGRGGHRVGEDGLHREGDVQMQPQARPAAPNSALSATWKLVVPGEDVGLVFAW